MVTGTSRENSPLREGLFDPMRTPNEPNIVVLYVIVGIVSIVIFTFFIIVLVIMLLRKKPLDSCDSGTHTQLGRGEGEGSKGREAEGDILVTQLNLYNSLGHAGGTESSEGGGGSPDIFDYLPSTKDCYLRGFQPSPSSHPELLLDHQQRRESGDGAEGRLVEPMYSESRGRQPRQFCPSSLIEAEYCRLSTLRKVAPPTLPKPSPSTPTNSTHPDSSLNNEERSRNCTTV